MHRGNQSLRRLLGRVRTPCEAGLRPAGAGQSPVPTRPGATRSLRRTRAIHQHERKMMEKMIAGLLAIPGLKLYGISDPHRFEE